MEDEDTVLRQARDEMTTAERWISAELDAYRIADFTTIDAPASRYVNAAALRFLLWEHRNRRRPKQAFVVVGAHLHGYANLSDMIVEFPIEFRHCSFEEPVLLVRADICDIEFSSCRLNGIIGERARIMHDFTLSECTSSGDIDLPQMQVAGTVHVSGGTYFGAGTCPVFDLRGSRIGNELELEDLTIFGRFSAEAAVVSGSVVLRQSTFGSAAKTNGLPVIDFERAKIRGNCELWTATVDGVLSLTAAEVAGDILIHDGTLGRGGDDSVRAKRLKTFGTLRIWGASTLRGRLSAPDATVGAVQFQNVAFDASNEAIDFSRVDVRANLSWNEQTRVTGTVRAFGGRIGGSVQISGTWLATPGEVAARLDGTEISHDLRFDDGLNLTGGVALLGASIGGQLVFSDVHIRASSTDRAVSADRVTVGDSLFLENSAFDGNVSFAGGTIQGQLWLESPIFRTESHPTALIQLDEISCGSLLVRNVLAEGHVDLRLVDAQVRFLSDDRRSWDQFASYDLTHFRFSALTTRDWTNAQRLLWLRHQESSQPHEQLASVLEGSGSEHDARTVRIDAERQRTRRLRRPARLGRHLFGALLGYGYRPLQRTLPSLLAIYLVGALVVIPWARSSGAITATRVSVTTGRAATSKTCDATYPCLSSWAFAADMTVPLVSLHQTDYWSFAGSSTAARVARGYQFLAGFAGWILATCAALGLTGIIRKWR